ncbi:MAG: hypothetical protein MJ162_08385 [Treponema sp.]|nr:hypothetical protein [Treponema sp.]
MTRLSKITCAALLFFCINSILFAEIISDTLYKFTLDIPEGYVLSEQSEDGLSYSFTHPNIPVSFVLKIVSDENLKNSYDVLNTNLSKLKAQKDISTFKWNNTDCSISQFYMKLDKDYEGWCVSAPLQDKKSFICLLCYCPSENAEQCNQFIISTLNSLCTNEEHYNTPGIIVSYAFPNEGKFSQKVRIGNEDINFTMYQSDLEASQFVVDLEYSVLCLYANHKLWKEAWQRYYRMIYRDNSGRLDDFFISTIQRLWPVCQKKNPGLPELEYAQKILFWVQTFEYKRANQQKSNSDFTSLCLAINGEGNDCDSRSMLVSALLRSAGLESFILISREYSHAMTTVEINAPGQKFKVEGTDREFLMGETTAKVTWGTIAQDHQDRSKWIPVYLP